jgi:hypothetical protein
MDNLAQNLENNQSQSSIQAEMEAKKKAAHDAPIGGFRSGTSKVLGAVAAVGTSITVSTVSVVVGITLISAMGLGTVYGLLIIAGSTLAVAYLGFGLATKQWNPIALFK